MTSFLAISLLGLFLGMRHATDPDHVIAVSTIVSKQRGVARAGLIGVIWGLGHTLTIFLVGAAIILFKVAIPPRVGLTMELSVGLMLILLGFLNLTGILQRIMARMLPGSADGDVSRRSAVYPGGSAPAESASDGNAAAPQSTAAPMGLFSIL